MAYFTVGGTLAIAVSAGTPSLKTHYLVFELNNVKDQRTAIEKLVALLGPVDPESTRQYGFAVHAIPCLTRSADQLMRMVHEGFDLAEEFDVPVMFHIDSMYGLGADSEPSSGHTPDIKYWLNPDMCEWVSFPSKGQEYGPAPRSWINWGVWHSPAPAIPCFGSRRFEGFMTAQLRHGVVDPVVDRWRILKKKKKAHLFIGLNVGWETHIPDYTPGRPLYHIDANNLPVDRSQSRGSEGDLLQMQRWEMRQTGYAALYWKGWNERKLARAAKLRGVAREVLFDDLCAEVVHDYLELLAKTASKGGIPKDRIFTHIVAVRSAKPNMASTAIPPIWTAVNRYSIPGFTMCHESGAAYDLNRPRQEIRKADRRQGRFAAVETYVRWQKDERRFTAFLDEIFSNGGVLISLYGCFEGGAYNLTLKPEKETLAIIKWLGQYSDHLPVACVIEH